MDGHGGRRRTDADEATRLAALVLAGLGVPEADATVQARHLVEADMRGHASHGLRRMTVLAERIRVGLISPAAEPEFTWAASGALVVDGRNGLGPVIAYRAMDLLAARAAETGVAIAAMHRTHHLGMLSPYVEKAAGEGLIAIVLTSTEGLVHPWGGAGALVGTNPLGAGIPAPDGDIILDMSTASVSAGKILDYAARGEALPDGWAVDSAGRPTTDAAAAAHGAISPFGGAKGYALGVTLGALVGALTGTAYGRDVHGTLDTTSSTTKGDILMLIDPSVFGEAPPSTALGDYVEQLRESGVDGAAVTVPGDRARAARAAALRDGFDIGEDVWATLEELAAQVGSRSEGPAA
ncbi:dehydrogenase [Microbacterium thalassium]|nr:Ldh family oxidoreductase [Microbacterium thalassium]GLK25761.1 dehydrogenase [Microbacterium thalassium]